MRTLAELIEANDAIFNSFRRQLSELELENIQRTFIHAINELDRFIKEFGQIKGDSLARELTELSEHANFKKSNAAFSDDVKLFEFICTKSTSILELARKMENQDSPKQKHIVAKGMSDLMDSLKNPSDANLSKLNDKALSLKFPTYLNIGLTSTFCIIGTALLVAAAVVAISSLTFGLLPLVLIVSTMAFYAVSLVFACRQGAIADKPETKIANKFFKLTNELEKPNSNRFFSKPIYDAAPSYQHGYGPTAPPAEESPPPTYSDHQRYSLV